MKRIYLILILLASVSLCHAQLPTEGDWKVRLGNIDQGKAKKMFEYVFSESSPLVGANVGKPIELPFYINFKQLTTLAPYCDYLFYSGQLHETNVIPTSMYKRMLDSIPDPAIKMMLVEDVVELGNIYVDNLDSVNVLRELNSSTKGTPLTMPLAKIKRAHYNYMYAHNPQYYPSHLYDREKAYKLYKDAFDAFRDAKDEQGGGELEGRFVLEYFNTCYDLYRSDEEKYYEQFLEDYQEVVQVCDKLLIPYYEVPDSIKNDENNSQYYTYRDYNYITNASKEQGWPDDGIKSLFKNSGAAEADRLRGYYAPRLEANRQNADFLNTAIGFMYANGFVSDSLFYYYCKASHDLAPTYENCIGLASSAYLGLVDKAEMRGYYTEALELASSEVNKAKIRFWIATSLYTFRPRDAEGNTYGKDSPEYQQWENDIFACNMNLKMMLESSEELLKDPSLDVRAYVSQAYYMMGENHYWLAALNTSLEDINLSIRNFETSSQMNLPDKPINGRNVNVTSRLETAMKVKDTILKRMADKKRLKKMADDYNEYMAKKKREEDFWNQK